MLSHLAEVTLAAIAEPCAERCQQIPDRHAVERRYGATQELLNDKSLDSFILVTPDELQRPRDSIPLPRGNRCSSKKRWWLSISRPLTFNRPLKPPAAFSYELQHKQLQQELASRRFGQLVYIRVKRNLSASWFGAVADRVHTAFESLILDLDLLLWLSGSQAIRLMAMERRLGTHLSPECCFASIELANGCIATAETSWFVPSQALANAITEIWTGTIDAGLAVMGTLQSAQLRLLDSPLIFWGEDRQLCPDAQLWPVHQGQIRGALEHELSDFVAAACSGIPSSKACLRQAIGRLQLGEAIVEASRTSRAVHIMPTEDDQANPKG